MGKTFDQYTCGDVLRLKGYFLAKDNGESMTDEQLAKDTAEQLDAVQHAVNIGPALGIDMNNMPVLSALCDSNRVRRVITGKVPIMKRVQELVAEGQGPRFNNSGAMEHYISKSNITYKDMSIETLDSEITKYSDSITDGATRMAELQEHIMNRATAIRSSEEKLAELTANREKLGEGADTDKALRDLILSGTESGDWDFAGYSGTKLYYAARFPAICSHKNLAAKVDITENLGYFVAEVRLKILDSHYSEVRLYPYKNMRKLDNVYHPHVCSGSICWGDASHSVSDMLSDNDLTGILGKCKEILTQYSDSNPYRSLASWDKVKAITRASFGHFNQTVNAMMGSYREGINYEEFERIEREKLEAEFPVGAAILAALDMKKERNGYKAILLIREGQNDLILINDAEGSFDKSIYIGSNTIRARALSGYGLRGIMSSINDRTVCSSKERGLRDGFLLGEPVKLDLDDIFSEDTEGILLHISDYGSVEYLNNDMQQRHKNFSKITSTVREGVVSVYEN